MRDKSVDIGLKSVVRSGYLVVPPSAMISTLREAYCYECNGSYKFFKLYRSTRPQHVRQMQKWYPDREPQDLGPYLMCVQCEVNFRTWEYNTNNDPSIKAAFGKEYYEPKQVEREIKRISKGDAWCNQGKVMMEAAAIVRDTKRKAVTSLNKFYVEHKSAVVKLDGGKKAYLMDQLESFVDGNASQFAQHRRDELEDILLRVATDEASKVAVSSWVRDASMTRRVISTNTMITTHNLQSSIVAIVVKETGLNTAQEAFRQAGDLMWRLVDKFRKYDVDLEYMLKADSAKMLTDDFMKEMHLKQEELAGDMDWQTAKQINGQILEWHQQVRYLKALDFTDEICPGMYAYNVCTRDDKESTYHLSKKMDTLTLKSRAEVEGRETETFSLKSKDEVDQMEVDESGVSSKATPYAVPMTFPKAKISDAERKCGLAFPSRLWLQASKDGTSAKASRLGGDQLTVGKKWGWKCRCEWSQIEDDAKADPESEAGKLWKDFQEKFHDLPVEQWPVVGCGQGFNAFRTGPSLVVEIVTKGKNGEQTATAFRSARLPWLLEDQLKDRDLRKALEVAGSRLDPEEVLRMMPIRLPLTHPEFWTHPKTGETVKLDAVARYPLDEWEREGAPYMSQTNWCELVMRMCSQNMSDLQELWQVGEYCIDNPEVAGSQPKKPSWLTLKSP